MVPSDGSAGPAGPRPKRPLQGGPSGVLTGAVSWEMTEPSGDASREHTAQLREASPVGTDGRDGGAGGEGAAARRPRGDRCSHTAQGRAPDTGQSHLPGPLPEGLIPA